MHKHAREVKLIRLHLIMIEWGTLLICLQEAVLRAGEVACSSGRSLSMLRKAIIDNVQ